MKTVKNLTSHLPLHLGALAALALSLVAGCGGQTLNQKLAARWTSAQCESGGPGIYVKRDFTLTESTWKLNVGIFTDAACSAGFATIDVSGPYTVVQDSASVAGATEVDYGVTTHTVTPKNDAALQAVNGGNCGSAPRAIGQVLDVTQTGCSTLGVPSVAACPKELDLNKIDGDNLYFGDRSGDLCKTRAPKLGQYPVTRAK